jgi:2-methylcitrate dehydratase PrpD
LTEELAAFLVAVAPEMVPPGVMNRAKYSILDWLGSAIAGSQTEAGRIILDHASAQGKGQGSVIGLRDKKGIESAAFANGALSHIVEMDDLHRASVVHPAAPVIPAALAEAQRVGRSGRELLLAVALGYEVAIRIGEAVGRSHYRLWHNTATCGVFGAAAAAGWLLGLSQEQMVWAMGNAGTQAAGLWQFLADGAMSKHLHTGKAARDGLLAAELAARGFTGAREILDGEQGFFQAMSQDAQPQKVLEALSPQMASYRIETVSMKPYPSCRHTHPAVDAALRLGQEHSFKPDSLSKVEVAIYRAALDVADNPRPTNPYAARFSLQYCVARALLDGRLVRADFTPQEIQHPAVRDLMAKTKVVVDEGLDALYPAKWQARVSVVLADGTTHQSLVSAPKGDPENPLTEAELTEKFCQMLEGTPYTRCSSLLIESISSLPDSKSVDGLLEVIRLPAG